MFKKHPNISLAVAAATLMGGIAAAHYLLPATPLERDFNSLSAAEKDGLKACVRQNIGNQENRVLADLLPKAEKDPKLAAQLDNPVTAIPLIIQKAAEFALADCAKEQKVDAETIPPLNIRMHLIPGPQPQPLLPAKPAPRVYST